MIELLVVCAIIIVLSALILIDNNKFGGVVTLENLAYDVALTVRQTQVYGIAVERFGASNCATVNCFSTGYGMDFSTVHPSTYYLFADLENSGVYDPSFLGAYPNLVATYPNGEVVETNTLQQGYYITGLCVVSGTGVVTCNPSVTGIDILYRRPEPEAYISASNNGTFISCVNSVGGSACYNEAQITLTSPKGDKRTVVVDATGQISVEQQ